MQLTGLSARPSHSAQRNSMPSPYGWDQNLTQMAAGGLKYGSTSVPTTPVGGSYFQNPNFSNFNITGRFPAQHNSFYAGTVSGLPPTLSGGSVASTDRPFGAGSSTTLPANFAKTVDNSSKQSTAGAGANVTDSANVTSASGDSGFNLVPNVDFDAWTDADSFFAQYEQSADNVYPLDTSYKKHQRKSSDLIQLGFEGILTSEEKEYFSLEYFDPLHRKGRTASISSPSTSSSNYFFAKPPEEAELVSKDRNNWVTFDDTEGMFDHAEGDGQQGVTKFSGNSAPGVTKTDTGPEESKVLWFNLIT